MLNLIRYNSLNRPFLTPPAWIFAPVWTILYITMFAALFLFAAKPSFQNKRKGYALFFSQIIINVCWAPVFFGLENTGLALILIIILDIFVLLNIITFYKISKISAIILIPYFIWILFATYLNIGIFVLN